MKVPTPIQGSNPFLNHIGWSLSEIRVIHTEGESPITAQDWTTILFSIMKVHEQWIPKLVSEGTPHEEWSGFSVALTCFDHSLQCGIFQINDDKGKAERFREILLHGIAASPPLQFLLATDECAPMVSAYMPLSVGYAPSNYVNFLKARNPFLQEHLFVFLKMIHEDGKLFLLFRTC